jgi:O-methyltransferase
VNTQDLLAKHPLISDQVNKDQLAVILGELERVLPKLDGAVVEFGCYIGTTSLFIRRLLDSYQDDRAFHVYDSFEGLPLKDREDESRAGEQFKAGELAVGKKQFLREFQKAGLRSPVTHKGWFNDLTPDDMPHQIAFAFLDGDFYASIRDSLKLVMPKLQRYGVIIIDDYAREALPGAAKAAHEFFRPDQIQTSHNLGIIHL